MNPHRAHFGAVPLAAVALAVGALAIATPRPVAAATALAEAATATGDDSRAMSLSLSAGLRGVAERSSAFAVDSAGAAAPTDPEVGVRAQLGLKLDSRDAWRGMRFELTASAESNSTVSDAPTLEGDRRPGDVDDPLRVTEAFVAASVGAASFAEHKVGLRAGLMLSDWGLGLLANDGRNYLATDGRSWFAQPGIGDRVLRAALWARPFAGGDSRLRGLLLMAAVDRVASDDILLPLQGGGALGLHEREVAWQGIFAARLFLSRTDWVGAYYVYRDQQHQDGKWLTVHSADLAGSVGLVERDDLKLRLSFETVGIFGTTNLGPSPDFPEHDVVQGAAVARLDLRTGRMLGLFDVGLFSGDASADDGVISNFKADPNFQQGILLFRRIVGWQTARMRRTASDPDIVGYPNEDLERLASGGSITSAITLFPRVGARFGLFEVYGGLLLALSPTPIADPFHTRTKGGGSARTVYNQAVDGMVLGSEVDAGVRAHIGIGSTGLVLLTGVEYGVALPGGAMAGLDGNVHGGRLTLTLTGDGRGSSK